jgi:hypothetical protein
MVNIASDVPITLAPRLLSGAKLFTAHLRPGPAYAAMSSPARSDRQSSRLGRVGPNWTVASGLHSGQVRHQLGQVVPGQLMLDVDQDGSACFSYI